MTAPRRRRDLAGAAIGLLAVLAALCLRRPPVPAPMPPAGTARAQSGAVPGTGAGAGATPEPALPVPPVPPRIARGDEYERCLAMLRADPAGAENTAEAWEVTGGGDGAVHCHALAEIELGDPRAGAERLEKLAADSRAPAAGRASVYGQAGQAWLMADNPGRAYEAATLALSLAPDDPDLRIDRAVAAASLRRYGDAKADLDQALAIDPNRGDALVFRGAALRHLDAPQPARADIDRALALDPGNPEALLERGILRQRDGDRRGAKADWQQAAALAPDSATADLARQDLELLEAGPERGP